MKPNNQKPRPVLVFIFIPLLVLNFTSTKLPNVDMKVEGDIAMVVKTH